MGYTRTALLMAAMTALFIGVGYLLGGGGGAVLALLLAAAMNLATWWGSDRMVLAMHGARPVPPGDAAGLHDLVATLARAAGLPVPAVYLIDTAQPNAFATGRNPSHAAVAVTAGLLHSLDREELAGVIAHELAHIRNHDTAIMTVTATFAGAITMLANFALFFGGRRDQGPGILGTLALMLLAPLAAVLVQTAISRTREYAADRAGAEICGQPLWLASALDRIAAGAARIDNPAAERNPATAHLFIVNPLHAHAHDSLFATHPATENRVRELRQMAAAAGQMPAGPGAARRGAERQGAARPAVPRAPRPRRDRGPWG